MTFNVVYLLNILFKVVFFFFFFCLFLTMAVSGEERWKNSSDVKRTYFSLYSVYHLNFSPCVNLYDGRGAGCIGRHRVSRWEFLPILRKFFCFSVPES